MVDRLRVKTTIVVEYDVIPLGDVDHAKDQERNRSIEDTISLLRHFDSRNIKINTDFEEVQDVPE